MAWLWLGWALAQAPITVAPTPQGETRFVVADTATTRFLTGPAAAGPALAAGEAVTVVTEADGRVRVFVRGQFGWVDAAGLTTELPAVPEPTELPPLLPPG